jgi:hypothetical protein
MTMKNNTLLLKRLLFYAALGVIIFPVLASGDEDCGRLPAKIGHGEVLWTRNAIVVQGTAAPDLSDPDRPISEIKRGAQRAATLDAYRRAAMVLQGVRITCDSLGADNEKVVTRIQAYVRQPKICKTKFYADGGVDMVVMVPLAGELANGLLPDAGSKVATSKSSYTGLIVDATELPFAPAIAPRLLGPNGTVLFSQENVKKEVIAERGAVKYVENGAKVKQALAGKNPLRIKAVGLGAISPSDLVLSQDAETVLKDAPAFLGDGRIIIIIKEIQRIKCKGLESKVEISSIDWEKRLILARGKGKVNFDRTMDDAVRLRMMERAAEVDAQRILLDAILKIQINDNTELKEIPKASERAMGIVRNAVRCNAKYFKDGTAEVVLAAPIDGITALSADRGGPMGSSTAFIENQPTGLIIDASRIGFEPVLAPCLMAPDATVIYGPETVSRAYIAEYGVAGYASSINMAKADPRIGNQPIILKVSDLGSNVGQLVMGENEVGKLIQLKEKTSILTQGRVIIVTENTLKN